MTLPWATSTPPTFQNSTSETNWSLYQIYERDNGVAGTWLTNTYPVSLMRNYCIWLIDLAEADRMLFARVVAASESWLWSPFFSRTSQSVPVHWSYSSPVLSLIHSVPAHWYVSRKTFESSEYANQSELHWVAASQPLKPLSQQSLSTHLNSTWSESHPPQTEILEYWQRIAVEEGIIDHVRFGFNYKSAKWNDESCHWELELEDGVSISSESAEPVGSSGKRLKVEARVLVSGIGGFSKPIIPTIKGLPSGTGLRSTPPLKQIEGEFNGIVVHSARYPRHGLELSGKHVLVIGNGCSGSQIVPEISKDPTTKVFAAARSAQWFMPQWVKGWKFVSSYIKFF